MPPQRLEVRFRGRVQGVGFRYTTRRVAADHPIVGYVMNLPDGSVEMVAEGDEAALRQFCEAVETAMANNIADATRDWQPASGEFQEFEIRF